MEHQEIFLPCVQQQNQVSQNYIVITCSTLTIGELDRHRTVVTPCYNRLSITNQVLFIFYINKGKETWLLGSRSPI